MDPFLQLLVKIACTTIGRATFFHWSDSNYILIWRSEILSLFIPFSIGYSNYTIYHKNTLTWRISSRTANRFSWCTTYRCLHFYFDLVAVYLNLMLRQLNFHHIVYLIFYIFHILYFINKINIYFFIFKCFYFVL